MIYFSLKSRRAVQYINIILGDIVYDNDGNLYGVTINKIGKEYFKLLLAPVFSNENEIVSDLSLNAYKLFYILSSKAVNVDYPEYNLEYYK